MADNNIKKKKSDDIFNPDNKKNIEKIEFQQISEELIENLSVVEISTKTLYDLCTKTPAQNGPLDSRLGTSSAKNICRTCKSSLQECPGHWGRIKLALPVFNIGFIQATVIILNSICKECSRCLLPPDKKILYHDARNHLENIRETCKKVKKCFYCGSLNGTVKRISFRVYHEVKKGNKSNEFGYEELSPLMVSTLFKRIPVEDYKYFGVRQNPDDLIIHQMLVPPSNIRPSVDMGDQGFNEDDLTIKIAEIVNINALLQQRIFKGVSFTTLKEDWLFLQIQIALFINSDLPSIYYANATPIKGIIQRLKGKGGRFRMHLSGKRVDFSGRTVISPDPNLSVEEVGVPLKIAKELTFPEVVNSTNIEKLTKYVENGTEVYPGANYIVYKDGRKVYLKYARKKVINIGDTVERHLLNGDFLLFNRQPSLHRLSIMGHRVVVHQHKTLRFNVCCCTPYNADFDGDEMNIHFPQTYDAIAEAKHILGIKHNICTARNNQPLVSPTQDFITGMFLLTAKDVFFTEHQFYQIISQMQTFSEPFKRIDRIPCILFPHNLFSGKQVVEFVVEKCMEDLSPISLRVKNRASEYKGAFPHNSEPREFFMQHNRYIYGRIDKSIIGADNRKASLVYQVLKKSKSAAVKLMNSISKISVFFLKARGFSIGLSDVLLTKKVKTLKNEIVMKNLEKVNEINSSGLTKQSEMEICSHLNQIRELCGNVCINNLSIHNAAIVMQECGSKGSKINVSQMIACVGQQIVSGNRIEDGMLNRTLPHFNFNDNSPSARGFVFNSFFTGLSSYEYFFHAVSGREGLVDTVVKTADTGYMQRRLMKALEDLHIFYDKSVRNSSNTIIQFEYGDDGIDPLYHEDEIFNTIFTALESCIKESENITDEEICNVINKTFSGLLCEKLMTELFEFTKQQNSKGKLNRENFHEFCERILKYISRAKIAPGTAIGAITGQSIGEPGTQMTLKTFHFAGVASMNITLGVPRLKEIINATINISTPIINIASVKNLAVARSIQKIIEKKFVRDFCYSIETIVNSCGITIDFLLDMNSVNTNQLNTVIAYFENKYSIAVTRGGISCVFKNPKENSLYMIEKVKKSILGFQLTAGFSNISKVFIKKNKDHDFSVILEGSDFLEVLGTKYVNPYGTTTNDIICISKVLGIEAARESIIRETKYTMESHGINIDDRHLMLLADTMANTGDILGITRYGIGKMKDSTLMKASFEQTSDILFNAAFLGKDDSIVGVSESIILGKRLPMGTGSIDILSE